MARTRPPTGVTKKKWVDMKFTITTALKRALKKRSAEEGISTQALIRRVLALEVMDNERDDAA